MGMLQLGQCILMVHFVYLKLLGLSCHAYTVMGKTVIQAWRTAEAKVWINHCCVCHISDKCAIHKIAHFMSPWGNNFKTPFYIQQADLTACTDCAIILQTNIQQTCICFYQHLTFSTSPLCAVEWYKDRKFMCTALSSYKYGLTRSKQTVVAGEAAMWLLHKWLSQNLPKVEWSVVHSIWVRLM